MLIEYQLYVLDFRLEKLHVVTCHSGNSEKQPRMR